METYRCQMLESVCRTIRSSGSNADQRDRSDLIGMHARNPNNRTAVLDPESVLAIRQAGSDLVMVDQDLVQNALRKYEQFQDQGAVLACACPHGVQRPLNRHGGRRRRRLPVQDGQRHAWTVRGGLPVRPEPRRRSCACGTPRVKSSRPCGRLCRGQP